MDLQKALQIVIEVAEGATYDSEYDGFCNTYCCFCHANLSHRKHSADCLMLLAQDAAKEEIAEINKRKEKERHEAYKKTWQYKIEQVPCEYCGKKVKRIGLRDHIRASGCGVL